MAFFRPFDLEFRSDSPCRTSRFLGSKTGSQRRQAASSPRRCLATVRAGQLLIRRQPTTPGDGQNVTGVKGSRVQIPPSRRIFEQPWDPFLGPRPFSTGIQVGTQRHAGIGDGPMARGAGTAAQPSVTVARDLPQDVDRHASISLPGQARCERRRQSNSPRRSGQPTPMVVNVRRVVSRARRQRPGTCPQPSQLSRSRAMAYIAAGTLSSRKLRCPDGSTASTRSEVTLARQAVAVDSWLDHAYC
jgi:hypothetical protein